VNNRTNQSLPFLPEWLARKIDHWIEKKTRNESSVYKITRRNIYILPSKHGWLFILTLFAILSGAINYNNSMAYLLCFFLASLGFIAMLQTHQNLNNIIISPAHTKPVLSGQPIEFNFSASANNLENHFAISTGSKIFNVSHDSNTSFFITESAKKRGLQNPQRFKLYTEFPLGLFHAWTQVKISSPAIIYPRPIKSDLISSGIFASHNQKISFSGDDDYASIREFQKGDTPKKIAWKLFAKTNQLYTKELHTESGEHIFFDFDKLTQVTNTEERLSVLCGLILHAHKEGIPYGLKISHQEIKPDHGDLHKQKCLTLLALYQA